MNGPRAPGRKDGILQDRKQSSAFCPTKRLRTWRTQEQKYSDEMEETTA